MRARSISSREAISASCSACDARDLRVARARAGAPAAPLPAPARARRRSSRRSAWRRSRPACTCRSASMRSERFDESAMTRSSSAISIAFFCSMLSTSRVCCEAMRSASSASSTPMRWRSMASRRLSSAASIASVARRSRRLRWSPARTGCVPPSSACLLRDARRLDQLRAPLISASSSASVAGDFELARLALGCDQLGGGLLLLGDARGARRLPRGDLGLLDRALARDLLLLGLLLAHDAGQRDLLLLRDPRRLDRLARGDVGFLDRAVARDFERRGRAPPARCAALRSPRAPRCPASSSAWLRSISSLRVACSAAMRSAASALLARDLAPPRPPAAPRSRLPRSRGLRGSRANGCARRRRCARR